MQCRVPVLAQASGRSRLCEHYLLGPFPPAHVLPSLPLLLALVICAPLLLAVDATLLLVLPVSRLRPKDNYIHKASAVTL